MYYCEVLKVLKQLLNDNENFIYTDSIVGCIPFALMAFIDDDYTFVLKFDTFGTSLSFKRSYNCVTIRPFYLTTYYKERPF